MKLPLTTCDSELKCVEGLSSEDYDSLPKSSFNLNACNKSTPKTQSYDKDGTNLTEMSFVSEKTENSITNSTETDSTVLLATMTVAFQGTNELRKTFSILLPT